MSTAPTTRRAAAEINFGEGEDMSFKIGNRSIHQFWHLFSAHFRHVLLAPQRRPDSGRLAWNWREAIERRPVTATELAEVRRRLSEANRSLAGGFSGLEPDDDTPDGGATTLEGQVRASVTEMVGQLIAHRDAVLTRFVCRTDAGLMLHSWGSPAAAEPYFPDAQSGEISGVVMVGAERPASISVVLENAQGAGVARVKSDQDGAFHFSNIAAGSYRVRVADRSDFPAGGLAVIMERDSINGLELRASGPASDTETEGPLRATDGATPWYKLRVVAVLAVLLVLGGGSCVWRSVRPGAKQTAANTRSIGWQSASGQLAAGDAKNSSTTEPKVGEEGAWSSLSKSVPAPVALTPHHVPTPTDARNAGDRVPVESADSDATSSPAAEGKTPPSDPANKATPRSAQPLESKPAERKAPVPGNPSESSHSPEEQAEQAGAERGEAKAAENKLAKASGEKQNKKGKAAAGASQAPADESPAETTASAGSQGSTEAAVSPTAPNGNKAGKSAAAKKNPAATGTASASASADGAETGAQDAATSSASDAAGDRLKDSVGKKSKERINAVPANTAVAATDASPNPVREADTVAESPEQDSAANKNVPPAASRKKPAAAAALPQSRPVEQSSLENSGDLPTPEAAAAANKTAKSHPAVASKAATATKSTADMPASASQSGESPAETAQSPAATGSTPLPARAKSSRKKSAPAPSAKSADESPAEESVGKNSPNEVTPSAVVVGETEALLKIARVHASAWQARVVQDSILPTRPLTAAEEDGVEAMREKLLQERTSRMPEAFRRPQARGGFVLEFSPDAADEKDPPRWRDETGNEPPGTTVQGERAELSWSGSVPSRDHGYVLTRLDGREIARLSIDQAGGLTLKVSPGTHAWYWLGVEVFSAAGSAKTAFDWRLSSGGPLPASWPRDGQWRDSRGRRVDIPLDATTARVGHYGIALVDPSTGWALACEIALQ